MDKRRWKLVRHLIAPFKGIQDSLGFYIPCHGFRILIVSRIPDSLICILESKVQDSTFHKQTFSGFRYPDSLTWSQIEDALALCNRNPARIIFKKSIKISIWGMVSIFLSLTPLNKKWIRKHTTWISVAGLMVFWHCIQLAQKASAYSCLVI